MTQYSGANTFPVSFELPDDTAPPTASEVNVGLEALGDRTKYLYNHRAVQTQTFSASGTWTAPADVTFVEIEGYGGGGGGAGGYPPDNALADNYATGGGGGGGAILASVGGVVVPGRTYTVDVGSGGLAGAASATAAASKGSDGNSSYVYDTVGAAYVAIFAGGKGGSSSSAIATPSSGTRMIVPGGSGVADFADPPRYFLFKESAASSLPKTQGSGGYAIAKYGGDPSGAGGTSVQGKGGGAAGAHGADDGTNRGGGGGGGGGGGPRGAGGGGGAGGDGAAVTATAGGAGVAGGSNTGAGGGGGGGGGSGATSAAGGAGGAGGSGQIIIRWSFRPMTLAITWLDGFFGQTALDGDVDGDPGTTTVERIQGIPVSATTPTAGDVLTYSGSLWMPSSPASSITLAGDVTGLSATTVVAKLRGQSVSATTPTEGQVLSSVSGIWTPTTPSAGLVTALDVDFATLANQTLATDTNYSLGGFTFGKGGTAAEAAAMENVLGQGIIVQPAAASDWNYAIPASTAPRLAINIGAIIPLLTPGALVRISLYVSAETIATSNYHGAFLGLEGGGAWMFAVRKGRSSSGAGSHGIASQVYRASGTNVVVTATPILGANHKVLQMTIPSWGDDAMISATGPYSGGWPAASAMVYTHNIRGNAGSSDNNPIQPGNAWINFGAHRGGSATALSVTIARLKVEYRL